MVVLDRDTDDSSRQYHSGLGGQMPPTPPAEEKPYHAKRPHRKSRMGCRNCKTRKVKCDEKKPSCRNCILRKEICNYPPQSPSSSGSAASRSTTGSASASAPPASSSLSASGTTSAAPVRFPILTPTVTFSTLPAGTLVIPSPVTPSLSTASPLSYRAAVSPATSASTGLAQAQRSPLWAPQSGLRRDSRDASSPSDASTELAIVNEPVFKFGGADEYDMKLLWFYTTETYASFSVEEGKIPFIDRILKSTIPKFAFQSPFLMDCILGLSALHMQSMNLSVPQSKAITYRAKAFAGYRQAIEKADPTDFPALLICSLLLTALSSELFREADVKPLYIIDWMIVWRGIGLIFDLIPVDTLYSAGLEKLFSRPAFNLNAAALHIPSNLLFMVSSIKEGDEDYPYIDAYYDTLKFLGGVYADLEAGFSPVLSLRIITWFTFLPKPFIEMARQHRPRALVILAHYLAFFKLVPNVWWTMGIGDRGIQDITDALGPEWQTLLNVPRAAMHASDRVELAKLIQGNHAWEPSAEQASVPPTMVMVNNVGEEVAYDRQRGWVPLVHNAAPASSSSGSSTPSPR
ncbi:unnamed protein product [Discula destructiva]